MPITAHIRWSCGMLSTPGRSVTLSTVSSLERYSGASSTPTLASSGVTAFLIASGSASASRMRSSTRLGACSPRERLRQSSMNLSRSNMSRLRPLAERSPKRTPGEVAPPPDAVTPAAAQRSAGAGGRRDRAGRCLGTGGSGPGSALQAVRGDERGADATLLALPLALAPVQLHGGADQRFQRLGVDRLALADVDRAPGIAFQAGVEQAGGVRERGA